MHDAIPASSGERSSTPARATMARPTTPVDAVAFSGAPASVRVCASSAPRRGHSPRRSTFPGGRQPHGRSPRDRPSHRRLRRSGLSERQRSERTTSPTVTAATASSARRWTPASATRSTSSPATSAGVTRRTESRGGGRRRRVRRSTVRRQGDGLLLSGIMSAAKQAYDGGSENDVSAGPSDSPGGRSGRRRLLLPPGERLRDAHGGFRAGALADRERRTRPRRRRRTERPPARDARRDVRPARSRVSRARTPISPGQRRYDRRPRREDGRSRRHTRTRGLARRSELPTRSGPGDVARTGIRFR